MNKQDRQGVRTAQDLERKYNLGELTGMKRNLQLANSQLTKVNNELYNMLATLSINLSDYWDSQSEFSLWFYSGIPTLEFDNQTEHFGDIYYDRENGYVYQYSIDGWSQLDDASLIKAMALTNADLMEDDHERKVFKTQPTPPYESGDWWIKDTGTLYICQLTKGETEVFDEYDFISFEQYTKNIAEEKEGVTTVISGSVLTVKEACYSWSVQLNQKIGSKEIISSINMTPEKVKIEASKVELGSYATIDEMDGVMHRVGEVESSVQQQADQIASKVSKSEVQTLVDQAVSNAQLGTKNLLVYKHITGGNITYNAELGIIESNGSVLTLIAKENLKPNTEYTIRFDTLEYPSTVTVGCGTTKTLSNTTNFWTFTTPNPVANDLTLQASSDFKIYGLRVTEGNIETPYSPSPEDSSNTLASLIERIDEAEEKITPDAIVNTVRSSAQYKSDFAGGRNLLKESDYQATTDIYNIKSYYLTTPPIVGEDYTISVKGQLGSDRTQFGVYNSGGTVNLVNLTPSTQDPNTGIYTATFKWKNTQGTTTVEPKYVRIYQMPSSAIERSTVEWVKFEKGTQASDWTPAPEDLEGRMDVAESSITQNANNITLKVSKGDVSSQISQEAGAINISSNRLTINSTYFKVSNNGNIEATGGTIGGWSILPGHLKKETTVGNYSYQMYMQASDGVSTTNAFAVRRKLNPDGAWETQFAVSYLGKMTAKNADITGKITADTGSIGSWNIGDMESYTEALYSTYCAGSSASSSTPEYATFMRGKGDEKTLAFGVKKRTSSSTAWADADTTFYVRKDGYSVFTSGKIANITIGSGGCYGNALYTRTNVSSTEGYEVGMKTASKGTDLAFYVKKSTDNWATNSNTFFVRHNGGVYCSSLEIDGGSIGGTMTLNGGFKHTRGNYTIFVRAVPSTTSQGCIFLEDVTSGSKEYPFRLNGDGSAVFTKLTVTGSSTIASACIPNLNASKITAGTLSVDRIPSLSAGKITSGTIATARLDASVITTGNFSTKTLSTGSLTVASGCRLGVASEYNAKLYSSGGYTWMEAFTPSASYLSSIMNIVRAGVNVASSREIKNDIHDFDDRYDTFFDKLNPQLFKYNFETNLGYSMGFIWEEARASMDECDLSENDLGAIHESPGTIGGKVFRKDDFIALNTWQIQKLKKRIDELERKLQDISR